MKRNMDTIRILREKMPEPEIIGRKRLASRIVYQYNRKNSHTEENFKGRYSMQVLKDRIRKDGKVKEGNVLKVDSFLNHQMDTALFREMGKEFKRRFAGEEINKILTIEASGIGIACVVAEEFHVPVVFAKKTQTKNIAGDVYKSTVESYTHGRV